MRRQSSLIGFMVIVSLLGASPSASSAPIEGLWSIESGSSFMMVNVGRSSLVSGTDGGLMTGQFQPDVPPTLPKGDTTGSARIIDPSIFNLRGFPTYVSTNKIDPVDGRTAYSVPAIVDHGDGTISADLSAWDCLWNGTHFNLGAPKSAGKNPDPTGTYDKGTGVYTLSWKSLIVGGPFNGFTGEWKLVGKGPQGLQGAQSSGEPYGDINVKIKAPRRADNCRKESKKVTIRIGNSDFGTHQATPQTVTYTVRYRGKIFKSDKVILKRNQKVTESFQWDPSGRSPGKGNVWEVKVAGNGVDPDLSNNKGTRKTYVKGKCGP